MTTYSDIVADAIGATGRDKRDQAAEALLMIYARHLDAALAEENKQDLHRALKDIGPRMLETLAALQMTPASRAAASRAATAADAPRAKARIALDLLRAEISGGGT